MGPAPVHPGPVPGEARAGVQELRQPGVRTRGPGRDVHAPRDAPGSDAVF